MTEFQAILFLLSYLIVRLVVPMVTLLVIGTLAQRHAGRVGGAYPPPAPA